MKKLTDPINKVYITDEIEILTYFVKRQGECTDVDCRVCVFNHDKNKNNPFSEIHGINNNKLRYENALALMIKKFGEDGVVEQLI